MPRIPLVNPESATGTTRELLDAVKKKMGKVPNLIRSMANSPDVLKAYLGLSGALGEGTLPVSLRELIALAVSQHNACGYCLAAHTALAKNAGLSDTEILAGRRGRADDPKADAVVKFALKMTRQNGEVSDADVESLSAVGFSNQEIAEIVGNISLTIFTNYFHHMADSPTDFPEAPPLD